MKAAIGRINIGIILSIAVTVGTILLSGRTGAHGAVTATSVGGSSTMKTITLDFTTDGVYTWQLAGTLSALQSLSMSFKGGTAVANTFSFSYVRAGVTHNLMAYSGTNYHTVVWFPANDYHFQEGDQLIWSNTTPGKAVLVINANIF